MLIGKNKRKVGKKALCLVFAFLLSIESFAAVVSDNDGSAFVSKAEFEALKKDFSNQIDKYNSSIDNKIDGAIASYLAGTRLGETYELGSCTSIIKYPLTFAMKNKVLDLSTWSANGATPYWAPDYKYYIWGWRGNCCFLVDDTFKQTPVIKQFYNGKWIDNHFHIDSMIYDVEGILTLKTKFYEFLTQHANETDVTFGFVCDQTGGYARQSCGSNTITRDKVKASGVALADFFSGQNNYDMYIEAIWTWGYKQALNLSSSSTSNEHYLNQFKAPSGGGYLEGNNPDQKVFSSSLSSKTKDMDFVMNAYDIDRTDATGKRIELPVSYENHIWLTNKNNFKRDLQGGTIKTLQYWNGYSILNSLSGDATFRTKWWFAHMVSPGYTLEPQFSGYSTHEKYQKSLMEPQDMYYEVATPYNNVKKEQCMIDGILVSEANGNLDKLKFTINIESEDDTIEKYLVLAKNPIPQMDYNNIDTEAAADKDKYLKLFANEQMIEGTEVNKFVLTEGKNSVYVKDIKKDDLVYYKILWDKNSNSQLKVLEAPKLFATRE